MATFPNSATKPSYFHHPTTAVRNNLFLDTDTLAFTLANTAATAWTVRNLWGTTVASGSVTSVSLTVPPLGPGWYRLYLTGPSDANYGTSYGTTCFCVFRANSGFPVIAPAVTGGTSGHMDSAIRVMSGIGPPRPSIGDAANPTVDPNGLTVAGAQDHASFLGTYWMGAPYADSVRPREMFVAFPNGTSTAPQQTGVTSVVNSLYPSIPWFEGPSNEPTVNAALVPAMQTFYNAVKAANANAKVLGPNPVTFNATAIAGLDAFLAAGGGNYLDGLSLHGYNVFGDLATARRAVAALTATLGKYGFSKPLWMTEMGDFACHFGVFVPRLQASRWTIMTLMLDQLGVPIERTMYFYDTSHGFWAFPSFFEAGDGSPFPIVQLARVFAEEIRGKTYTAALTFGGGEWDDIWVGNTYTDATTGAKVHVIAHNGLADGATLDLTVTGATSVVTSDAVGVTTTYTVTSGKITVPCRNVPTYIRAPAGVTITPPNLRTKNGINYGTTNRSGAIASDSSTAVQSSLACVTDGVARSPYYYSNSEFTGLLQAWQPHRVDNTTYPQWLRVDMPTAHRIDRVVITAHPLWQSWTNVLDADVQVLNADGITWTTVATISEAVNEFAVADDSGCTGCTYETFYSWRCIYEVAFTAVKTKAIRLYARSVTPGGITSQAAFAAMTGDADTRERLTVRQVSIYCTPGA